LLAPGEIDVLALKAQAADVLHDIRTNATYEETLKTLEDCRFSQSTENKVTKGTKAFLLPSIFR
jgi:hypothetical protein